MIIVKCSTYATLSLLLQQKGIVVAYDVTDQESFCNIKQWFREVEQYAHENVNRLLVGCKGDLINKKVVEYSTARAFADTIDCPFIETSAKYGTNVEVAFMTLASAMHERLRPCVPST